MTSTSYILPQIDLKYCYQHQSDPYFVTYPGEERRTIDTYVITNYGRIYNTRTNKFVMRLPKQYKPNTFAEAFGDKLNNEYYQQNIHKDTSALQYYHNHKDHCKAVQKQYRSTAEAKAKRAVRTQRYKNNTRSTPQ